MKIYRSLTSGFRQPCQPRTHHIAAPGLIASEAMRVNALERAVSVIICEYSAFLLGATQFSSASAAVGEWLSLVEHLVRDQGVGGSNPLSPTIFSQAVH